MRSRDPRSPRPLPPVPRRPENATGTASARRAAAANQAAANQAAGQAATEQAARPGLRARAAVPHPRDAWFRPRRTGLPVPAQRRHADVPPAEPPADPASPGATPAPAAPAEDATTAPPAAAAAPAAAPASPTDPVPAAPTRRSRRRTSAPDGGPAPEPAAGSATDPTTPPATEPATGSATESATESATGSATGSTGAPVVAPDAEGDGPVAAAIAGAGTAEPAPKVSPGRRISAPHLPGTPGHAVSRHRIRRRRPVALVAVPVAVATLVAVPVTALVTGGEERPAPPVVQRAQAAATPPVRLAEGLPGTPGAPGLGVARGKDVGAVARFERWLGRDVDLISDQLGTGSWREISRPTRTLREWAGAQRAGRRLVLGVPMLPADGRSTLDEGASGEYDPYFAALGRRLVAAGHEDAVLRVGWGFNVGTRPWSTGDAQLYVRYFRRVVTVLRGIPGQEFVIDWSVANGTAPTYDATGYYPGDDVVDVVGVEAFDVSGSYPYPKKCSTSCRIERQRWAWERDIAGGDRGLRFWARFAAQHGKPLSVPSWGLSRRTDRKGGGDDLAFIRRMHEFLTAPRYGVVYHAYADLRGAGGDHRLTRMRRSGPEYRRLFSATPATSATPAAPDTRGTQPAAEDADGDATTSS